MPRFAIKPNLIGRSNSANGKLEGVPSVVNPPVAVPTQPIGNSPTAHLTDTQGVTITTTSDSLPKPVSVPPDGLEPWTRQPIAVEENKQVEINSQANSPDMVRSILNANPPGLEPLQQKNSKEKTMSETIASLQNDILAAQAKLAELTFAAASQTESVRAPEKLQSTVISSKQVASVVPFEKLHCTDGEVKVGGADTYKSAYELGGFKRHHYATSDLNVYKTGIEKMNLGDLQAHAVDMGFMPSDNRQMLIERLTRKFAEETSPTRGMNMKKSTFDHLRQDPVKMAEALKILSKGK